MITSPYDNLPTGMKKSDLLQAAGAAAPGISLRTAERMQASAEKEAQTHGRPPETPSGENIADEDTPSNVDTGYASGDTSQKAKKGIENEDASKILSGAGASADENPNEKLTQGAEDISDENPSRETEETEVPSSPYQPLAYEPSSPETGPEEPSYETVFESSPEVPEGGEIQAGDSQAGEKLQAYGESRYYEEARSDGDAEDSRNSGTVGIAESPGDNKESGAARADDAPRDSKGSGAAMNAEGSSPAVSQGRAASLSSSGLKAAEARYSRLSLMNRCPSAEYVLPFEETLIVPDAMPDMEKMLFAEGNAKLSQSAKAVYTPEDTLSGDITVYAVYAPDRRWESPVDVVKASVPFSTDKCWSQSGGNMFRVQVSVKRIEASMVNERKFTVSGQLSIKINATDKKELMIFQGTEDEGLIQLHRTINPSSLETETEDAIDISQEITLREDQPRPARILKVSTDIIENHRQVTSGKLVINATINSDILYGGELEGRFQLCCIKNKTDFSQFIPISDTADSDLVRLSFNGDDLSVTIENQDKLLLQGQVRTSVCVYSNKEVSMVSDAYHRDREVSFDLSRQELLSIRGTVSGEVAAREVINLEESSPSPAGLLCGSGRIDSLQCIPQGGRLIIEGSVDVRILALDEEEAPFTIKASVPLRGALDAPYAGSGLTADMYSSLKDFWFDKINSRQVEVNVSAAIDVWISSAETFTTIENLAAGEPFHDPHEASMALYVVGGNDTLWDIAKRYKSDVGFLAEINEIDSSLPLPEGMKLFVMK